jgi:hypothetical protein
MYIYFIILLEESYRYRYMNNGVFIMDCKVWRDECVWIPKKLVFGLTA